MAKDPDSKKKQVNVRVDEDMLKRLDAAADGIGAESVSTLIRMILVEFLPEIEQRIVEIRKRAAKEPD